MPVQANGEWTVLDTRLLRGWRLPPIAADADKEARGRVLVIAGSREIPGAAVLAGTAALRAGAGKLAMATTRSVAQSLAFAMPEARVIALPETAQGGLAVEGLELLQKSLQAADAILVGPGLMDEQGTNAFVEGLLPLARHAPLILDALGMNAVGMVPRLNQPVLLTPHAGEMAHLRGISKEAVLADPQGTALAAASELNATVALKGGATFIASPAGGRWRHDGGHPGLATSGSGDVLAGLIAGLAAQQIPLEQACGWGIVLHAQAGLRLARSAGPMGYLARELPAEVPGLMRRLGARRLSPSPRE